MAFNYEKKARQNQCKIINIQCSTEGKNNYVGYILQHSLHSTLGKKELYVPRNQSACFQHTMILYSGLRLNQGLYSQPCFKMCFKGGYLDFSHLPELKIYIYH